MPVSRYRGVEEMPPPWTEPDDPRNLRRVAAMMALYRSLPGTPVTPRGVRRFTSVEEMNADRPDILRQPG